MPTSERGADTGERATATSEHRTGTAGTATRTGGAADTATSTRNRNRTGARTGTGGTEPNPFDRRTLLGMTAMLLCGLVTVLAAPGTTRQIVVAVLVLCAEAGMLVARRTLPSRPATLAAAVTIVSGLAALLLSPNGIAEVPVLVGAAVLPLCMPAGTPRTAAVVAVSLAFGAAIVVISGSPAGLLAGAGVWFLAERSIESKALQAERDRAVALLAEVEASRQAQQEAAAAEERNRIAREMHDVLAHSLAGLSVHLQAIRAIARREGSPASLTGPLDRAADLARDGVQEARAAVGALRAPHLHGVDDLRSLVDGFPGAADLRVTGHAGRLGAEAGHAVYRAVQEAMTNAARYATGSAIEVRVGWDEQALRVAVSDHGLPTGHRPSGVKGSGTGLRSMRERIEAVGGTATAGPEPHGGWRIELRVPVGETVPASGAAGGTTNGVADGAAKGTADGAADGTASSSAAAPPANSAAAADTARAAGAPAGTGTTPDTGVTPSPGSAPASGAGTSGGAGTSAGDEDPGGSRGAGPTAGDGKGKMGA